MKFELGKLDIRACDIIKKHFLSLEGILSPHEPKDSKAKPSVNALKSDRTF